jgi:hypothetical protein
MDENSLTDEQLRELFEVLKQQLSPPTSDEVRTILDKLGGFERLVLGFYERLIRTGHLDIAADLVAYLQNQTRDPRSEVALEAANVLASITHEA